MNPPGASESPREQAATAPPGGATVSNGAAPEATAADRPRARRRSGVVVPHRASWHQRLAARAVHLFIRCLALTIRFRLHDASGHFTHPPEGTFIFAIWHNRLSLALILYERYVRRHHPSRRMAAMVSASRDGGLLARILELFRVEPVRGSSSRRGPQALRELVSWAERGYDLAITPDGPRGPRCVVQEGVTALAQLTGIPIIPVSYHLHHKWEAGSWDRFQIPYPFTRCDIRVGTAVRIPREASDAEREAIRRRLEETLRTLGGDAP